MWLIARRLCRRGLPSRPTQKKRSPTYDAARRCSKADDPPAIAKLGACPRNIQQQNLKTKRHH